MLIRNVVYSRSPNERKYFFSDFLQLKLNGKESLIIKLKVVHQVP